MKQPGSPLADSDVATLLRIQRAAYLVEAALIGDDRIPALHETEADLRAADLLWVFDRDPGGEIRGALGFRAELGETDIHRLIVDPKWHRHGIGKRLVQQAMTSLPRAIVSTGRQNQPARALYEGLGFAHIEDREVIPGLWVSDYRWGQPGSVQ